ncbi:divergent PAP2 family protein [Bacillus testis]|uniref:divergent PAP2 family protein n=1 Tax=Bacillus testis TaxID=1622072 RepID=UPI00067E929E|nr:divergent PAP2 family protein [Bacillus testis]
MAIFQNFPLVSAFVAIFFAQFVKVPITFLATRRIDWSLLTSTGGMPSSHSAAVTALATAIAYESGLQSPLFAIAVIFAVITMFDAKGVRRQAGEQAAVLNQLVHDFTLFVNEAKKWPHQENQQKQKQLKELLGHKPIEVFFGAITGILISIFLHYFVY